MPNLFDGLPAGPTGDETTDTLLAGAAVRIERIVSFGQSSGWYDQDEDEWVAVLTGSGVLEFEDGATRELAPGDFEYLPRHRRHRVASTAQGEPTVWLAVFIG